MEKNYLTGKIERISLLKTKNANLQNMDLNEITCIIFYKTITDKVRKVVLH